MQVSVKPTPCVDWSLEAPKHGTINCLTNENSNGLDCLASCNPGYRFTDQEPVKTYTCVGRGNWAPSEIVPDCVPESKYPDKFTKPNFDVLDKEKV